MPNLYPHVHLDRAVGYAIRGLAFGDISRGRLWGGDGCEIIGRMRAVAPPGQRPAQRGCPGGVARVDPGAHRGQGGRRRRSTRGSWRSPSAGSACPRRSCRPAAGATVLVTGGTGCIGSTLMAQVAARGPGRLVSVSRGITDGWPTQARRGVPAGRRPGPGRPGGADPRGAAGRDLPRRRAA